MRHLLISAAVLAVAAGTALAQPDHDRGRGHEEHGGGPAPQAQPHAAPPARAPEPQRGGPQSFTNHVEGHQPDQGQRGARFEEQRSAPRMMTAQQPAGPAADRGERHGPPDRGQHGNFEGRSNAPANFNRNPNENRFASRPGNPTFSAPRHDFSSFRDFHRDFRAPRQFRAAPYRAPMGYHPQHWSFGEFLPRPYWVRDYWLMDFAMFGLPPPPYGAVWVRVGPDALLIDEYSGEIITVAYDVFY